MRDFDAALKSVSAASTELVDGQFHLVSRSLCQGLVYQQRGEEAAAKAAFERARTALEARVRELPDDARSHAKLGLAYALLGRAEDAISEGKYAVEIYPPSVDAYIAPARVADLVNIYAVLGENDRQRQLGTPHHLTH